MLVAAEVDYFELPFSALDVGHNVSRNLFLFNSLCDGIFLKHGSVLAKSSAFCSLVNIRLSK